MASPKACLDISKVESMVKSKVEAKVEFEVESKAESAVEAKVKSKAESMVEPVAKDRHRFGGLGAPQENVRTQSIEADVGIRQREAPERPRG